MSDVRKKGKQASRVEQAQHVNDMQSRIFNNQMQVMENSLKKKLKVIQNEKQHVSQYLHFLRSSSGTSPFSLAPKGKQDSPRIRPASARLQRLNFGCDGNANHSYMTSNPEHGWRSSYYMNEDQTRSGRAKSACMSRSRMTAYRTTMSRVIKSEEPLQKRVSWIDDGDGGDDGIRGFSSVYRSLSAKASASRPATVSAATQCEPENNQPVGGDKDEVESVSSRASSTKRPALKKKKRESVPVKKINVTFPFPVTPNRSRAKVDIRAASADQFLTHDRRRNLTSSINSRRPSKVESIN